MEFAPFTLKWRLFFAKAKILRLSYACRSNITDIAMLKIISANLNGVRSAAKKGFFEWMAKQNADAVCVQELKAQAGDMSEEMLAPPGYHGNFHYAEKKGYSGVGIYSRKKPDAVVIGFGNKEFDDEGRYVQCDFGNLSIISVYCPSGSSSEERQQAKFRFMEIFLPHLEKLSEKRARNRHLRRLEHRAQGNRPEELEKQPKEFRLPAGRTRVAIAGN